MLALDALNQRRSIRNFDPSFVIPKEDLDKIITATLNSPSAVNVQEHDLIVLTNKEKISEIDKICFPLVPEKFQEKFKQRQKEFGTINPITYDCSALILIVENERAESKWGKIDAGILSMSIMIAAEGLGYGSVALGIIVRPEIEKLLNIETNKLVLGVAIGKPKDKVNIHKKEILRKVKYIE